MTIVLLLGTVVAVPLTGYALSAPQQSATKGQRNKKNPVKTTGSSKGTGKTTPAKGNGKGTAKGSKRGTQGKRPETSADVKKRQEATQKEIKLTEEQIRENERQVRTGLSELGKLSEDIDVSKKKIAVTAGEIATLDTRISGLEAGISTNEKELKRLKDEYLKAVKKMRLARRGNSTLAFIFASENFNQALRRMRYLRQFSEWKDRQSEVIGSKTKELKKQREGLAKARGEQSVALIRQRSEQNKLQMQYSRQDAIVADLKKNGVALQSHLSKKQAEANQLKSQIATLIAQEEAARKAAEEKARKAAEEKARKAAEEKARKEAEAKARLEAEERARVAAEEKARKEAEEEARLAAIAEKEAAERLAAAKTKAEKEAAEKRAKEAAEKKAAADKKAKEKAAAEKKAKEKAEKERKKLLAEEKRRAEEKRKAEGKRKDEASKEPTEAPSKVESASAGPSKAAVSGDFAKMRGSLPRPVSGSFRVTSRFGRQSLPDLPDVVYDNPGIDAEVASGASALAVYGGKVSGVYMIPGYNTVIIVNHGNYYTVYGNISSPVVKVGDQVRPGQALGTLANDEDNTSKGSIHFEVWRNREKLNPLDWIR